MASDKGNMDFFPQALDREAQIALLATIREVVAEAPLFTPAMPRSGKPMSVRMTNCGPLGWVTDKERGYRYQATHPETGRPWPAIPGCCSNSGGPAAYPAPPEACLVNYYAGSAKMGLHQDKDEEDFAAPVLSVSLGDTGIFRVGGRRRDPTQKFDRSPAMWWCSAGRTVSPITASTASRRHVRAAARRWPFQSHAAAGDKTELGGR